MILYPALFNSREENKMIISRVNKSKEVNRYETKAIENLLANLVRIDTQARFFQLLFDSDKKIVTLNKQFRDMLFNCLGFRIKAIHIPVLTRQFNQYGLSLHIDKQSYKPSRNGKVINIPC